MSIFTERAVAIRDGISYLLDQGTDVEIHAEHDVIYAKIRGRDEYSLEEQTRMGELGWYWNDKYSCWEFFT
jgi:hypothetical protein